MGLFKKKHEAADRIAELQTELLAMRERLDRADAEKATLVERLGQIGVENQRIAGHVDDVDELRAQLERFSAKISEPPPEPPPMPAPIVDPRVDELEQRLADIALVASDAAKKAATLESEIDRTPPRDVDDELRRQVGQLAEKVTTLDGRVTQISVELTNQMTELGGEMDVLQEASRRADAEGISELLVDITDGQERLANEQARYEMQFRADLAEIADRIRRPSNA